MWYTNASVWVIFFFFHQSVIFKNLMKKLIVQGPLFLHLVVVVSFFFFCNGANGPYFSSGCAYICILRLWGML